MQEITKNDLFNPRENFYESFSEDTEASLEEICLLSNSEAKNFMSVVEYKKCFRFFHPRNLTCYLSFKRYFKKYERVIKAVREIIEVNEIMIYIYILEVLKGDSSIFDSDENILLLGIKFGYKNVLELVKILGFLKLKSIDYLTENEIRFIYANSENYLVIRKFLNVKNSKTMNSIQMYQNILLSENNLVDYKNSDEDFEKCKIVPDERRRSIFNSSIEILSLWKLFSVDCTTNVSEDIYQILKNFLGIHKNLPIPFNDRSIKQYFFHTILDYTKFYTKLAFCALFCTNKRKIAKRMAHILVTGSVVEISEFGNQIVKKDADMKRIYERGANVHLNDGAANMIIEEFIDTYSAEMTDEEVENYIDIFYNHFKEWKNTLDKKEEDKSYITASYAIGFDCERRKTFDLDGFPGIISSNSLSDTFTISEYSFKTIAHNTLRFIASLVKFCMEYKDPNLNNIFNRRNEAKENLDLIFIAFAECLYLGNVVCDWGKVQHIITVVLSGRFFLKNGDSCDLSLYREGVYLLRATDKPVNVETKTIYNIEDISIFLKSNILTKLSSFDPEDLFRLTFSALSDFLKEGIIYDVHTVFKVLFLMDMYSGIIVDKREVSYLDYENSFISKNIPELDFSRYISLYYEKDMKEFLENNPEVVKQKEIMIEKQNNERREVENRAQRNRERIEAARKNQMKMREED